MARISFVDDITVKQSVAQPAKTESKPKPVAAKKPVAKKAAAKGEK